MPDISSVLDPTKIGDWPEHLAILPSGRQITHLTRAPPPTIPARLVQGEYRDVLSIIAVDSWERCRAGYISLQLSAGLVQRGGRDCVVMDGFAIICYRIRLWRQSFSRIEGAPATVALSQGLTAPVSAARSRSLSGLAVEFGALVRGLSPSGAIVSGIGGTLPVGWLAPAVARAPQADPQWVDGADRGFPNISMRSVQLSVG